MYGPGEQHVFIGVDWGIKFTKISTDGIITTVARLGAGGYGGDGRPATSAHLNALLV